MRLTWLLSLPAMLSVVSAMAIQKRDADFLSVRTKMTKDMSGRRGDPKGKYFHESVFHPHYDGRFADKQLGYRERKAALSNLIQTYLATFSDIGVETWLMHGTLLGWWWNRRILPWDSDSDVQVTEASMHYLATYYNMSVFHYKTPRIPEGRDYMLEVNPHYVNRDQTDKLNVIDARWVDTTSGLFIDITTARYNETHPAGPGMLSCKDGHEYRDTYIFPLRDTFFEGAPAKIPFAYKEVLVAEYQDRALTLQDFEGHHFDENKFEWIPVPKKQEPPKPAPQAQKQEPPKQEAPKPAPAAKQEPPKQEPPKQEPPKQETAKQEPPKQEPPKPAPAQNQQGQAPPQKKEEQAKPNSAEQKPSSQQPRSEQTAPSQSSPAQKPQQPTTQQTPPQEQKQVAPAGAQPQGQTSPPPPVSKSVVQVDPKQKAIEEKTRAAAEKRTKDLSRQEEKRKADELKAIAKQEKRKAEEQAALKKVEDKKAQKAAQDKIAAEKKASETPKAQA